MKLSEFLGLTYQKKKDKQEDTQSIQCWLREQLDSLKWLLQLINGLVDFKTITAETTSNADITEVNRTLQFNWTGLTEIDWAEYRVKYENGFILDGDYIGNCRIGDLCFDLITHLTDREDELLLTFDLYVGGVDTGYGYSAKELVIAGKYQTESDVPAAKQYPYDYADGEAFDDSCTYMMYEDFKAMAEERFAKFIAQSKYSESNLLMKAREPLHIW